MPAPRLVDRRPEIAAQELVAALVPPPRFTEVRFDTYVPNPDEPSQAAAVIAAQEFAQGVGVVRKQGGLFNRVFSKRLPDPAPGLYFDGGFGVGKTHLLASLWHAVPFEAKSYGTFVEITHLVGALGFAEAVRRLSTQRLLAIDEFELDDPGDTTLVTRLLTELTDAGVHVAATSNTLPDKLGEGRFAAHDFIREISKLSARFTVVRVDGPDYRHRGLPAAPDPLTGEEIDARAAAIPGSTVDDFDELCAHLATLHPSRYGKLVADVPAVFIKGLHAVPDQDVGLRMVALADRLYDRAVPIAVSGESLPALYTDEMIRGGYRKKYLRSISRLTALARDAGAAGIDR